MHINGTVLLYHEVDEFLKNSKVKFDGMFVDLVAAGSVIAAKKHGVPVVAQFMGPVMEPFANATPYWERHETPVENPLVRIYMLS